MRFPPAGWAWPPGPRVSAAHNSGVDGRGRGAVGRGAVGRGVVGREKGPMQAASGFQRDKTLPAAWLGGPPGTKLSQRAPKRRFLPTFRMQGELFTASATNNPSRENFIPHAVPLPVQNSPSRPARRPTRYKTLPASGLGRPTRYKTLPATRLGGPPGTKLSQRAPKRRFRPTFRMQGELCTASATNNPSRENFIPHAVPLPVQNSPSKRP